MYAFLYNTIKWPYQPKHSSNYGLVNVVEYHHCVYKRWLQTVEKTETRLGRAHGPRRRSIVTFQPSGDGLANSELLLLRIYRRLEAFRGRLAEQVSDNECI